MSVSSEVSRLQTAKSDISKAIAAKGITVPSTAKLDTYDDYISQIVVGGNGVDYFDLTALTTAAAPQTLTVAKSYDVLKYNGYYYIRGGLYSSVVWFVRYTILPDMSGSILTGDSGLMRSEYRINLAYNSSTGAISAISETSTTGFTNLQNARSIKGTWRFCPRPDWGKTFKGSTGDDTYNITFTSNSKTFTEMEIDAVSYDLFYDSTTAASGASASYPGASQTTWTSDNYRTITITGGDDINNSTLLSILQNNAFKYKY